MKRYRVTVLVEELQGDETGYIPHIVAKRKAEPVEEKELWAEMHHMICDIAHELACPLDYQC